MQLTKGEHLPPQEGSCCPSLLPEKTMPCYPQGEGRAPEPGSEPLCWAGCFTCKAPVPHLPVGVLRRRQTTCGVWKATAPLCWVPSWS